MVIIIPIIDSKELHFLIIRLQKEQKATLNNSDQFKGKIELVYNIQFIHEYHLFTFNLDIL